jgi:hypothetical protein
MDHQWSWTNWLRWHNTCSLLSNHHIPIQQDHIPNSHAPKHWLWAINNIIPPPMPTGLPSGSFLHVFPPKPCMDFPSPLYMAHGPTNFFRIVSKPMHTKEWMEVRAVEQFIFVSQHKQTTLYYNKNKCAAKLFQNEHCSLYCKFV